MKEILMQSWPENVHISTVRSPGGLWSAVAKSKLPQYANLVLVTSKPIYNTEEGASKRVSEICADIVKSNIQ